MVYFHYKAFLSYAHKDSRLARRVHKSLESYPIPNVLKHKYPKGLKPIFRDEDELTASHSLSDAIKKALQSSEFLIVLCSPATKTSYWVNEEIRQFKRLKRGRNILVALAGENLEDCLPETLIGDDTDPLAANFSGDNYRLGINQLIASMLGVGLDDLVQRQMQRQRRRVIAITVSALSISVSMVALAWVATNARSLAEQRRNDAEGLIQFMLTDLKTDLEAVGRLDVIQATGLEALKYYENYPLKRHDNNALLRRAEVFRLLGNIADELGNDNEADLYFAQAFEATRALQQSSTLNEDTIFSHGRSAYFLGDKLNNSGQSARALVYFKLYLEMAEKLYAINPNTKRSLEEIADAHTNLGFLSIDKNTANFHFQRALNYNQSIRADYGVDIGRLESIVYLRGHLAGSAMLNSDVKLARAHLEEAMSLVEDQLKFEPNNAKIVTLSVESLRSLCRLYKIEEEFALANWCLNKATTQAEHLLEFEPKNFNTRYEAILLGALGIELDLHNDKILDAYQKFEKLQVLAREIPADAAENYRAINIKNTLKNQRLLLAIYSGDKSGAVLLATEHRKNIIDEVISLGIDIQESTLSITSALLVNQILDDKYTQAVISRLCKGDLAQFTLNQRLILASLGNRELCTPMRLKLDRVSAFWERTRHKINTLNFAKED